MTDSVLDPVLQAVIIVECSLGMPAFCRMEKVCLWMLLYVHVQWKWIINDNCLEN